jgi:hypothetical protein
MENTENHNKSNDSKLYLCLPALNQFYYLDNNNLEYSFLEASLKDNKSLYNEITFADKKQFTPFISSNIEFIIFNEKEDNLKIDREVIETYLDKNQINLKINFLHEEALFNHITANRISSKNFIILDNKISTLLKFHNIGCWTILLTPLVFSHLDKDEKLQKETIEIIKNNVNFIKESESSDLDKKFFRFSTNNFYQLFFYYLEIEKINLSSQDSNTANLQALDDLLNKLKPVRVLQFLRTLRRSQEFKKQRFYISNEKVLFLSHIGGDDISINLNFDIVLAKTVEVKDLKLYSDLLSNIVSYCEKNNLIMANNISLLKKFVEKDHQGDYLTEFINSAEIQEIKKEYSLNVYYPSSTNISLDSILDKNNFNKILHENNLKFPLVIKYKGHSNYFKHLITYLFEETCVDNYIKSLTEINEEDRKDTTVVLQSFVNHGGRVMKIYHINNTNFIDYRHSLPDVNKNLIDHFKEGYWTFKTIELENGKYKEILEKFNDEDFIKNITEGENSKKLEFAYKICDMFQKFSKFSLFGVDLLYAYEENAFYIIDVNSLPGYKIKNVDLAEMFREHMFNLNKNKF